MLPRVSILSPCYNVAPYIGRFLESLISQSYKNLEIIFVNDGSTDDTAEVIKSYLPRLQAEGYSTHYIEQENGGQSSAINNGLKHVTGKYLTWPDSDDWFTPDSIETKVRFMEHHPECGMLRGNVQPVLESSDEQLPLFSPPAEEPVLREDFFHHLIFENAWLAPVGYMVRTAHLDATIPGREIYVSRRAGQNWQIMLPIAQKYKCWQLPGVVGYYLIRNNSHSHSHNDYAKQQDFMDMCEDILINTLNRIPEGHTLLRSVNKEYNWRRLVLAYRHRRFRETMIYLKRSFSFALSIREKLLIIPQLVIPLKYYRACQKFKQSIVCKK